MFGYIVINKAEMKFKDFDIYHAYYCGLCRVLKEQYGMIGQLTLSCSFCSPVFMSRRIRICT